MALFHVYPELFARKSNVPIASLLTNVLIAWLLSLIVFLNCCEMSEKGIGIPNWLVRPFGQKGIRISQATPNWL